MTVPRPPIATTDEWGAVRPREPITPAGRPHEIVFHHTAGHHPEIARPRDESREELYRYAREIQRFHMAPGGLGAPHGGIDSGHNFLIGRNGLIVVGRHQSLPEVEAGRMVVSAHCPGHNTQPGIEHEHDGAERMTTAQRRASAWLMAWIIHRCNMEAPTRVIRPHGDLFATSCPGTLRRELPRLRMMAAEILHGKPVGV